MDRNLQTILLGDNPWLQEPASLPDWLRLRLPPTYLPRFAAAKARERWSEADRAHLVIGPRQAGKSTSLWAYLSARGEPALFIDCEQGIVREWCRSAPLFLADLERLVDRPVTLFFEEIQHLEEAGLFLKGLVDRKVGVPILVTGSSSYHLGARTRESLAGRASRTRLLPLSLPEVCQDLDGKPPILRERLVEERLARHLVFGGYPAVWLSENPEALLADLLEAMVLRDASDLFRIARPDAFRQLLRLLAGQAGSLVNLSEWASILGIGRDTVASYLEILESSHLIVVLSPFAGGKRVELTARPKIYLLDNGLRNRLLHDFHPWRRGPMRVPSWRAGWRRSSGRPFRTGPRSTSGAALGEPRWTSSSPAGTSSSPSRSRRGAADGRSLPSRCAAFWTAISQPRL
ncbi:MAG TPA: ATP-binding protein [Thermoanaerobaculia bacterium]|nr:ATP-binding protein [Thermoanaerobaculia bacterium]